MAGIVAVSVRQLKAIEKLKLKLTTKSQIDIRLPEQKLIAKKKMRIYSSASIAANPMLYVRASPRSVSSRIAGCVPCVEKQALLQGWLCVWICMPCKCACFGVGYFFLPLLSCFFFFDSGK